MDGIYYPANNNRGHISSRNIKLERISFQILKRKVQFNVELNLGLAINLSVAGPSIQIHEYLSLFTLVRLASVKYANVDLYM